MYQYCVNCGNFWKCNSSVLIVGVWKRSSCVVIVGRIGIVAVVWELLGGLDV